MRWVKYLVLFLLLLLAIAVPLAQDLRQTAMGALEGLVIDERGNPIAGARVEATNVFHGGAQMVTSERNGFYRVAELVPGTYALWAQATGYTSEWIPKVVVEEGKVTHANIQLTCERRPTT